MLQGSINTVELIDLFALTIFAGMPIIGFHYTIMQ